MPDMDPRTIQFVHEPQDAETILQSALMYAADNVYPYCTRWLLRGRRAKVNVSSSAVLCPIKTSYCCLVSHKTAKIITIPILDDPHQKELIQFDKGRPLYSQS